MTGALIALSLLAQLPLERVDQLVSEGNTVQAEAELQRALDATAPEDRAPLLAAMAELLARTNRPTEASARAESALQLEPALARAHHVLATLRLADGAWDLALTHAAADLKDDPACPEALGAEQEALLSLGRFDDAAARFASLRERGVPVAVHLGRARGLLRSGALTAARTEAEEAAATGVAALDALMVLEQIRQAEHERSVLVGICVGGTLLLGAAVALWRRRAVR